MRAARLQWRRVADQLRPRPFESLLSNIKIHQAGFHEWVDTEQMFASQLRGPQEKRILPS